MAPAGLVTNSPNGPVEPSSSTGASATQALPSSSGTEYYDNASSRGVVLAASQNVAITDLEVSCIRSKEAEAVGIDIRAGSSDVALRRWSVKTVSSAAAGQTREPTNVTPVGQIAIEVAPNLTDISLGAYKNLRFSSARC